MDGAVGLAGLQGERRHAEQRAQVREASVRRHQPPCARHDAVCTARLSCGVTHADASCTRGPVRNPFRVLVELHAARQHDHVRLHRQCRQEALDQLPRRVLVREGIAEVELDAT